MTCRVIRAMPYLAVRSLTQRLHLYSWHVALLPLVVVHAPAIANDANGMAQVNLRLLPLSLTVALLDLGPPSHENPAVASDKHLIMTKMGMTIQAKCKTSIRL
jgi:hypothetical protein